MGMLLRRHYKKTEEVKDEAKEVSFFDFNKLKVDELRTIAKGKGLEGYSSMTKAQLIELLEKA